MPTSLSFSISIETLNLHHEPIERFRQMLVSLGNQSLPVTEANEVVILDSGDGDPDELEAVCAEFPWLSVVQTEPGITYDDAKKEAATTTTGDVIVYADSDCVYDCRWLESLLAPFADPEVQVVAGETSTRITGPYSMAMAMTCCFPCYSHEEEVGVAEYYEFNNVAMRRGLLSRVPLPDGLPALRGCGFLHSVAIHRAGLPVLRHPVARADHPIAGGLGHFTEHFIERGVEPACTSERLADWSGRSYRTRTRFGRVVYKTRLALAEDHRRWRLMPLAALIAAGSAALYGVGRAWGRLGALRRCRRATSSGRPAVER